MLVAEVAVNQQFAPDDVSDANGDWELLWSPIFIANATLTVRLSNVGANGYVLADAIRIERVGEFPSGWNTESGQKVTFFEEAQTDPLDAALSNSDCTSEWDESAEILTVASLARAADELSDGIAAAAKISKDPDAVDLVLNDWL